MREKSQKARIHVTVQQQGASVTVVFNLHLFKSGVITAFLTRDPELIFPKQNEKKKEDSFSRHARLCFLIA